MESRSRAFPQPYCDDRASVVPKLTAAGLRFASFVNPNTPMWMGFADQQVNASSPAQDVTFLGGHGIKLTNAVAGNYFDNGAIQHLSHVLLDLQQFYLDGNSLGPLTVNVPVGGTKKKS